MCAPIVQLDGDPLTTLRDIGDYMRAIGDRFSAAPGSVNHNSQGRLITPLLTTHHSLPNYRLVVEVVMREVTEIPMYELTDAELDTVSGGFFDFLNTVTQVNAIGTQLGVAFGGAVAQLIQQSNNSTI
jgi:hypothetical protein